MQPIISVVAALPTRIKWLEDNYPNCELTWFKTTDDFMELFQEMEKSGRLQVIISEDKVPILSKALLIGPSQLQMGYSHEEIKFLIDNALVVHEAPAIAAFA